MAPVFSISSTHFFKVIFIPNMNIISVLLLAFFAISCQTPAPTNDQLFDTYFTPFINAIEPVNGDEISEDNTTKAFVAYENKDYAKAEGLFFTIYRKEKKSFALFYAAMSQMAQGKMQEARTMLKIYLNYPNDSFTTQAHWYMALTYLKEGKRDDAIRKLNKIVADNADFKVKAKELTALLKAN